MGFGRGALLLGFTAVEVVVLAAIFAVEVAEELVGRAGKFKVIAVDDDVAFRGGEEDQAFTLRGSGFETRFGEDEADELAGAEEFAFLDFSFITNLVWEK